MSERPILFSAPMVRALLAGTKTQTRRLMKPQPIPDISEIEEMPVTDPYLGCVVCGHSGVWEDVHSCDLRWKCPYGVPGDRLWVKETWGVVNSLDLVKPSSISEHSVPIIHRASSAHPDDPSMKWRPCLFMRRWMSRITLEIVSVRCERLQDISEADAVAEGVSNADSFRGIGVDDGMANRYAYRELWESINGAGSWALNPWVWVVEFRRVQP